MIFYALFIVHRIFTRLPAIHVPLPLTSTHVAAISISEQIQGPWSVIKEEKETNAQAKAIKI